MNHNPQELIDTLITKIEFLDDAIEMQCNELQMLTHELLGQIKNLQTAL